MPALVPGLASGMQIGRSNQALRTRKLSAFLPGQAAVVHREAEPDHHRRVPAATAAASHYLSSPSSDPISTCTLRPPLPLPPTARRSTGISLPRLPPAVPALAEAEPSPPHGGSGSLGRIAPSFAAGGGSLAVSRGAGLAAPVAWMGVPEFAVEKARSLAAAADHDRCHVQKGELQRIETRRRQEVDHGVSTPRAQGAASPLGPPTPPRRPPEARSGGEGDAGTRCHPPCRDIRRVEEAAADAPGAQFLAPGTDFLHDFPDTDSSISVSNSMYRSMTPSPAESPTCMVRLDDTSDHDVTTTSESDDAREQVTADVSDEGEDVNTLSCIVDFGDDIWCPPSPEDERDDVESRIFGIDDEDDDISSEPSCLSANKIAGVSGVFGGSHKDGVQNDLLKHFKALVAQLLTAEGICLASDDDSNSWLEIVSSLAWQAASYVKPDTKKGGSMDPSDYVKIKCIASGNPTDSNFVRGIVCSKNVRHKRMVSEHRNARLLILGGALEYQKVSNKLASIGAILEQEKEYLRTIVGKIESRQPNVLLVEKSASSFAQELLAKDISLVLNVKRSLLDRISRCTGGQVASSIDNIISARLGQCDLFKVEKVSDSTLSEYTEKGGSTKTLMFFEGCLKRLGCTVLLRGSCREELKKIKRAMQLAVFAAYHLSLETSFLADEGATVPGIPSSVIDAPHRDYVSARPVDRSIPDNLRDAEEKYLHNATIGEIFENISASSTPLPFDGVRQETVPDCRASEFPVDHINSQDLPNSCHPNASCIEHLVSPCSLSDGLETSWSMVNCRSHPSIDNLQSGNTDEKDKLSAGYLSGSDCNQSILVSLSSTCIPKSLACERSHLLRIKFYGSFDKPLGRYLREDLFDQAYCCPSCKEPSESHVRCYMHQHGSLTISVRRLLSKKLPGEHDGRIWMWHRCMRCKPKDGMPPATHRVTMSDAAWGLSFGKFLELSFSNHMTANRIANCGHSLERDCLRFYGYGNMVAAFQYSPMVTISVNLPPPVLDFSFHATQEWVKREAVEVFGKMESLHKEVSDLIDNIEKNVITEDDSVKTSMQRQIMEMKDLLNMERNEYEVGIKSLKGGREVKMDLMVMENIFFQRTISKVYDLKGSVRSRYNSDTSGHNKVLLDSNLIEALHTKPMFLGSKAKRKLERAIWNDTSFLASLDVMDYSLLVGIDEEKKELVVGIIDFLRQYTWDKQLETWVKASGILGGPKHESPTVISPIQYKKRFRKAMSRYFLAVPDQWSS
nr:unnamed protein product [Digitaria exilis]